jgi:hypothetical protein
MSKRGAAPEKRNHTNSPHPPQCRAVPSVVLTGRRSPAKRRDRSVMSGPAGFQGTLNFVFRTGDRSGR